MGRLPCSTPLTARCLDRPACCWRTSTPTSTWAGSGQATSHGKCPRWPAASPCWSDSRGCWQVGAARGEWRQSPPLLRSPGSWGSASSQPGLTRPRPEYGAPGQGYAAALAEIEAAEGQRSGRRGDGIITIAPYHYQVPMAQYRGRLPIYGYATESLPLHPETESVLWRALTLHGRLWLVTVGLPPADPANGVEAWLAREAFKTEDRWLDDAALGAVCDRPAT